MRIVLDTNVFVAAFAARGLCDRVVELCLDRHEVAVCEFLLEEVRRNLVKKVKEPPEIADRIVRHIRTRTSLVTPSEVAASICRDPDDLPILGAAVTFAADFLVTGDREVLAVERIGVTKILTPSAFARILSDERSRRLRE